MLQKETRVWFILLRASTNLLGMKLNLSMARVVLPSKLGLKELINFYRLFQK
jgi:hypothetical protein